jgi:hypothetical protein
LGYFKELLELGMFLGLLEF